MNYHIDKKDGTSAYLQLYYALRRDILAEVYPCGSRLPSKRTIAAETGVSVITAEHALALLCDEGYAEARQRSGFFVLYRKRDFSGVPATPAERHMPQAHAQSGAFPFSVLAKTVRRVLLDYGELILVKSDNFGCSTLREAICAYLARSRAIAVKPQQVIVGSGAEYLYGLAAQLLKDRVFAVESPCYDKITKVYDAQGVRYEQLPLHADGIRSADLAATRATVLHVTPFNSYPSGITVGVSKKHEYLRWAKERGGIVIEDNYDSELTVSQKTEDALFAMADGADVIYLNTFSQTLAPSMRIGYLLLPERLVEPFRQALGFYSCTVPALDQYVLAELLQSGDFEKHINRVRRQRRKAAQKRDAD